MKRNRTIQSLTDLQLEISRVSHECELKERQLQSDVIAYIDRISIFSVAASLFKKKNLVELDKKSHFSENIFSFILPLLVNKLFMRNAGFLSKSVVALLSSKLGKFLDAETITRIYHQVFSWIDTKSKTPKPNFSNDYGIPPDSETY